MKEVWRDIPGWPNYLASSAGRIRNRHRRPGIMRTNGKKYLMLTLCRDGHRAQCLVHRLIALAFHGEPPYPRAQARHLNDHSTDNRAVNIAWGTVRDNADDAERNGRIRRGERNGNAKLSAADAYSICCRVAGGEERRFLAADFGITPASVSHIAHGRNWRRALLDAGYEPPVIDKRVSHPLTEAVVVRMVGLRKAGKSLSQIAKATGVPKGTITPVLGGHEPKWAHLVTGLKQWDGRRSFTPEEVRQMAARRQAGDSYQKIASEMGAGVASVFRILNGRRKSYAPVLPAGFNPDASAL